MIKLNTGIVEKDYYTYAWLRKDGTPYYIGKGRDRRAFRKSGPDKSRVLLLKQNLTEEEALRHEKYIIFILGRKDLGTGILRNYTEGGEGVSGLIHTEEAKKRIGESAKGRVQSEEQREKNRQSKYGNSWNKGRAISEKQKKQISETLKGVKHTEERRRRISESHKGKHWFNNGEVNVFRHECPEGFLPGRKK